MLRRITLYTALLGGVVVIGRRLVGSSRDTSRHRSQSRESYRSAGHKVLILGAGFGGLATALALERRLGRDDDTSILVIDRDNGMLFTPLLWTVADGRANPNNVVVPIRAFQRNRNFHVLHALVERIELEQREVHTSAGTLPYDELVIALGSITALPNLPGLKEHALLFHTPADTLQLRNHLIDAIEAAHYTEDEAESREWLTFVVGGGGDTGIELAATIHEYITTGLYVEYPWLADEPVRVVIVGRADRLVPMSDQRTSEAVRQTLEREGIEVQTGVSIDSVTDRSVKTSQGEIPARTLFWAAGITAPEVVEQIPVEHARNGALIVDGYLRVPDHPEVYAIGDSAWATDPKTGTGIPPTAQAAEHQGRYVADTIAAELRGRNASPFKFTPLGHLALLGRRTGVGRIGPVTLTGLPAWLAWHGYYLSHIPSWRNRLHLLTDWLLAEASGRETGQLRLGATTPRK